MTTEIINRAQHVINTYGTGAVVSFPINAKSVYEFARALLALNADYDKLAGECAALNTDRLAWAKQCADEMGDFQIYEHAQLFEAPATNAVIASIGAYALRDFASHLDEDDEQEGTVHFALMARADQLEGKLESETGLRGGNYDQ